MGAPRRDGVVEVVGAVDVGYVGRPEVGVARQVDAGAAGEDGALGGPGAGNGGGGGDGYLIEGLETVALGVMLGAISKGL